MALQIARDRLQRPGPLDPHPAGEVGFRAMVPLNTGGFDVSADEFEEVWLLSLRLA